MLLPELPVSYLNPNDPFGLNSAETSESVIIRFFDESFYLCMNPDIAEAKNVNASFDARQHFLDYGLKEKRSPSLYFDPDYVSHHLARIARETPPEEDLLTYFATLPPERRFVPNRWFSPGAFRTLYTADMPELEDCSDYEVFEIYLDHHRLRALSPSGTFNEERYRLAHPQVAAAIGRGEISSGFMHFLFFGGLGKQTNLPGTLADLGHGDEAAWLRGGQVGLAPLVWWFDEAFYLTVYPDVHELVRRSRLKSGLEHYLITGFREGRVPSIAAFTDMPAPDADPWVHFAKALPDKRYQGHMRPHAEICAVQRYLRTAPHAASRDEIADGLRSYIQPPELGGSFDAKLYLAVNIDVGKAFGDTPGVAKAHWQDFGRKEHRVALGSNVFSDRTVGLEDVLTWKSGVNYFGPLSSSSGLGTAARGYMAALRAVGIPVDPYDVSRLVSLDLPGEIFCAEDLKYSINLFCINADLVQTLVDQYGTEIFNHRANVGAWVWELPAPLPEWRAMLSAFDLIICPSDFCTEAFALSTARPVRTIPYVVDEAALRAGLAENASNDWIERLAAEKARGRKIILFIMDASSYRTRKGVDIFIALAKRVNQLHPEQYCFVIKTHSRDISMTHLARNSDQVLTIDALFSFAELCRLKALADLYVSPHRSEGFGLNIIESILLGVPVLCSDYAGATELLRQNIPPLVPVKLREIGRVMGPYRAEAVWAEPDLDAMEAGLLAFFAEPKPEAALRALQDELRTALSAETVGARLVQELTAHCALGAEHRADKLQAFRPLADMHADECYRLGYVTEAKRRSPDSPGLDRLGEIAVCAPNPFFSVLTVTCNAHPAELEALYDELLQQSYPSWEWCIADTGSSSQETLAALHALRRQDSRIKLRIGQDSTFAAAFNKAATAAQGRYLVVLGEADRLAGGMLACYVEHLRQHDAGGILYCDEAQPVGASPGQQHFKPGLSPELLLSTQYIGRAFTIRKAAFFSLGGLRENFPGAELHDLLLRALDDGVPFQHIAQILYFSPPSGPVEYAAAAGAIAAHLAETCSDAVVEPGLLPGTCRARPRLSTSSVVLNILTSCTAHHNAAHAEAATAQPWARSYVTNFVQSILRFPPALAFEIRVVVDHHALALAAPLAALDPRVHVIPFERKNKFFNFSEKANYAITTSQAETIVLLNDDMEAMDADWLTALLEPLELPGVGVVGGELLYEDDTLQHGGVALGIHGATAHLFEGTGPDFVAPNGYNKLIRNCSAVTGAMFAMRRSTFNRVRGFDERFPVDYNDIDFCLRVAEAGLRTVYTPFARLRHFESRSARRLAVDELDRAKFCAHWARYIAHDPYYNRNLSRTSGLWEPT